MTVHHNILQRQVPPATMLYKEEGWELLDARNSRFHASNSGWKSVIKHHCDNLNGAPYWMLLEWHNTPTCCNYCNEEMPPSIVCLFKLHNMEAMK